MSTSRLLLILAGAGACFIFSENGPSTAQPAKIQKPSATPVDLIRPKKDFKVELIYTVPRATQGSWVSLCVDPKGRLISSDQYGKLYRITPPGIDGNQDAARVEQLPVDLGEAQGLLWAFDSLYVVVNRGKKYTSGLWRVRSSNNNDVLDTKELLRELSNGGEHGPHAVLLGPDRKSLYVLHGNHTDLTQLAGSYVPRIWGEDFIVPRLWDASGHAVGRKAPAGCIYKTDPDGKDWTLVSMGYRNQYDAAFNRDGELFTYDADMEWDMNTPWYRPTRVCHAVPGSEFGWRGGTGKMYEYHPDNLPPVVNVGPGSPTGVCFGYGAKFPAKYQDALFLCDWSFGKLFACHMTPKGASYTGELEDFLVGSPLPLTDIVINPKDGAMYYTVGGRNTLSGLYRVTYVGTESTEPAREARGGTTTVMLESVDPAKLVSIIAEVRRITGLGLKEALKLIRSAPVAVTTTKEKAKAVEIKNDLEEAGAKASIRIDNTREQRAIRHKLESFYGKKSPEAATVSWPYLDSDDRFLRFAARTVLEFQDPAGWFEKANDEKDPVALTHALIALARVGDKKIQGPILNLLSRIDWTKLTDAQKIDYLRAYQLAFIRMGDPAVYPKAAVGARIAAWYPDTDRNVNAELCKLVCYLEPPQGVTKTLALLAKAPSQEEQMEYALALRSVKTGWTLNQREEYFNWFQKATVYHGGHSFHGFLKNIRKDAIASLTAQERDQLKDILAVEPVPSQPKFDFKKRDFVKKWTVDELLPIVDKGLTDRSFDRGRNLFGEAKCFACHRFANEGGGFGPDLTIVSGRFGPRDLLESIVEPSKVIADQYQSVVVTTTDGKSIHGRIINLFNDIVVVNTDMLNPDKLTNIDRSQIESMAPSKISMMPENLLDTYTQDEILDLVAYLFSRGDRNHKMFRKNKE